MKQIVIFSSKTGFTEFYAKLIAKALETEAVSLSDIKAKKLGDYDSVVFGGWIMASNITGLMKIRKYVTGSLYLFGVGATIPSEENTALIIKQNKIEGLPFFYMPGGLNKDKLSFFKRKMLDMVASAEAKNPSQTQQHSLRTSFDLTDEKYIEPLVKAVREAVNA